MTVMRPAKPRARRLLSGVAGLGLLGTCALLPLAPTTAAYADQTKTVVLHPGSQVTLHLADPEGVDAHQLAESDVYNELFGTGIPGGDNDTPQQCATDPEQGCIDVPIKVDIPAKLLKTQSYALNIVLTYNAIENVQTPVGPETVQSIRGYLWQSPPPKDPQGNPTYESFDEDNDPGYMSAYTFPPTRYNVELVQTRKADQPLTLSISLADVTPPQSLVSTRSTVPRSNTGPPKSTTPSTSMPSTIGGVGAVTPPATSLSTSGAPSVARVIVPNIKGGKVSAVLTSMSTVQLPDELGIGGAKQITGALAVQPDSTTTSPVGLAVGLGVLPVLAILLALFLVARRRRRGRELAAA